MKSEKHDWYTQMVRKLQINGKSERTVQAYTRAVHQLTKHYKRAPESISEEELEKLSLFDYLVINRQGRIKQAVRDIEAIIAAEKSRVTPREISL